MKGLELDIIFGIIIAIASVLLFLGLVTGSFKNAGNWIYCNIYMRVLNFFSGSENLSIPESCKGTLGTSATPVEINDTSNKIFSRKLLAYIISCWNDAEVKGLYESHPCYTVTTSGKVENVSEANVTEILIKEDRCKSIENSDYNTILNYDCGAKNQILWSVDGGVNSLTTENISDAINAFTETNTGLEQIPVDGSMIPPADKITTASQLRDFLAKDAPASICKSLGSKCSSWKYSKTSDYVEFLIVDGNEKKEYVYDINSIMSYLEGEGFVKTTINYQKLVLIEYNGDMDAVEVIA
jgi:hypothetical protein